MITSIFCLNKNPEPKSNRFWTRTKIMTWSSVSKSFGSGSCSDPTFFRVRVCQPCLTLVRITRKKFRIWSTFENGGACAWWCHLRCEQGARSALLLHWAKLALRADYSQSKLSWPLFLRIFQNSLSATCWSILTIFFWLCLEFYDEYEYITLDAPSALRNKLFNGSSWSCELLHACSKWNGDHKYI